MMRLLRCCFFAHCIHFAIGCLTQSKWFMSVYNRTRLFYLLFFFVCCSCWLFFVDFFIGWQLKLNLDTFSAAIVDCERQLINRNCQNGFSINSITHWLGKICDAHDWWFRGKLIRNKKWNASVAFYRILCLEFQHLHIGNNNNINSIH